jgi:hypothetical protein
MSRPKERHSLRRATRYDNFTIFLQLGKRHSSYIPPSSTLFERRSAIIPVSAMGRSG